MPGISQTLFLGKVQDLEIRRRELELLELQIEQSRRAMEQSRRDGWPAVLIGFLLGLSWGG